MCWIIWAGDLKLKLKFEPKLPGLFHIRPTLVSRACNSSYSVISGSGTERESERCE